jgi:DNA-binding IclR family transcriptional regulator
MRTYMVTVTDFGDYSLTVGELTLDQADIAERDVSTCSKRFARELRQEQPEMINKGLCLTITDEDGIVQLVAPMDTVH